MACKRKPKAGISSGSPPKLKSPRQTKKARVEEEVATIVEKATSPPKSKKTRQTKKERVEEEVATSVEKAASPPRKPVTQEVAAADEDREESRFIGKPMEDEEARKQYPKRYAGENPTFVRLWKCLRQLVGYYILLQNDTIGHETLL
ncbi:hypothetical protein ACFX1T_005490 [Malus domestica]